MPSKPVPMQPHFTTVLLQGAALAAAVAAIGNARAQSAPDAGRLLQETRPAPSAPAATPPRLLEAPVRPTVNMPEGATVVPSGFRVTGAVSFAADDLARLLEPWVGKRLDLRGLNEAAGAITRRYQSAGHFLSYAYLPAQRVADGVIEIAVLEGRLDAVQVANAQEVRLRDEVVQAHLAPLVDRTPLVQDEVERKLLLLNDLPGVVARAAFTPGASTGAADVVVSVAQEEPLEFKADLSNHGSPSTGRMRLGATLLLRDLFGWGDLTTARAIVSQAGGLVSGSLTTLVPVGGDGWKFGASLSRLRYTLGEPIDPALGAQGTAETFGLRATYPALRSARANLTLDATLDHKALRDDLTLIGIRKPKRNVALTTGLSFDVRDSWLGGGATVGSAVVSAGHLRLLDAATRQLDAAGPANGDGIGLQTDGSFQKLNVTFGRQQALWAPVSAYLRYSGQITRRNLDSSEKLALGGPQGVRAYSSGESLVDEGGIFSAELRVTQEVVGGNWQLALFYDRATGRINQWPLAGVTDNDARLAGYGLGLQWNAGSLGLAATLAWRDGIVPRAEGGDPRPRLYFQLFYTP